MRVQPWIIILIVVGVIALFWVAQHFGWIDLSNKSRSSGGGGGLAGIGDEVFHPTRHEAQIELDRQTILPAPAPLPGDDDFGMGAIRGVAARDDLDNKSYDGQVRIDLSAPDEKPRGKHTAND